MNAHRTYRWTFDRFVEWSFGPGVPFHASQLAYELEVEAHTLVGSGASSSRRFRDLARELRDLAEERHWGPVGNLAATLLARAEEGFAALAVEHEVIPVLRQLQSLLHHQLYQSLVRHLKDGDIQHPEATEPISALA